MVTPVIKFTVPQPSDLVPIDYAPWGAWFAYRSWRRLSLRRITDALLDDEAEEVLNYAQAIDKELARICRDNGWTRGQSRWTLEVLPALQRRVHPPPRPQSFPGSNIFEQARRVDIVKIAERVTELQPYGDTLKGLCPLHDEKTPSFVVSPIRQRWRCFGACVDGGDGIKLVKLLKRRGLWDE